MTSSGSFFCLVIYLILFAETYILLRVMEKDLIEAFPSLPSGFYVFIPVI